MRWCVILAGEAVAESGQHLAADATVSDGLFRRTFGGWIRRSSDGLEDRTNDVCFDSFGFASRFRCDRPCGLAIPCPAGI